MPDTDPKPTTENGVPLPAETPDRGVASADAISDSEKGTSGKQDIDRAKTAGREGGTR